MKKTEVRLIASILEQEHEDAEAAAKACIEALDEKRAKDDSVYVAVMRAPIGGERWISVARGPFGTKHKANKKLLELRAPGPQPGYGEVLEVRNTDD